MPDVRTFRAATMREALDRVRADLGREAVILSTRHVPVRRMLPWGQREEVEITAGIGIATKPLVTQPPVRQTQPNIAPPARPVPHLTEQERRAAEIVKELQQRHLDGPLNDYLSRPHQSRFTAPVTRTAPEFIQTRPMEAAVREPGQEFSKRLEVIERLLADLDRRQRTDSEIPTDFAKLHSQLVAADLDDAISRELITKLIEGSPGQNAVSISLREKLIALIESELRCCGPILPQPGTRQKVAFVGPTGVGKTTTLAKLAATFKLNEGLQVGLVTVDTSRIAAVDQLRAYASIIGLPMSVVATPSEMKNIIEEWSQFDLVLIDTAGYSPRDAAQISELASLLDAAQPDDVQLVLSLSSSRKSLAEAANRFAIVSPTTLIATKLDEAAGAGALVGLCRDSGLPVSYVTVGQEVPDDIELVDEHRIADWIVNGFSLESRRAV